MKQPKFWLVWNEQGHAPTLKHLTIKDARVEAERLAKVCPGHVFHVLELMGSAKKIEVQWVDAGVEYDDSQIPF